MLSISFLMTRMKVGTLLCAVRDKRAWYTQVVFLYWRASHFHVPIFILERKNYYSAFLTNTPGHMSSFSFWRKWIVGMWRAYSQASYSKARMLSFVLCFTISSPRKLITALRRLLMVFIPFVRGTPARGLHEPPLHAQKTIWHMLDNASAHKGLWARILAAHNNVRLLFLPAAMTFATSPLDALWKASLNRTRRLSLPATGRLAGWWTTS